MGAVYFQGAFGGIDLRFTSIRTDGGRDIATRSPARGNRHYNQDRGRRFERCDCELMFCDEPNKPDFVTRYLQFRDLIIQGDPLAFTHPLHGTYTARGAEMVTTSETTACVMVQIAFLPEDEPDPVTPLGAGAAPVAGVESVETAGSLAIAAVTAAPIPDSSGLLDAINAVVSTVQALDEESDLLSSKVLSTIGNVTGDLADAIDTYELAGDVKRWAAYRAVMGLMFQSQRAAEMFIDDAPEVIQVQVAKAAPLLAILAEVYGASLAQEMVAPVARKNRIANPGRVPAGTVLACPGEGARV